LITTGTARSAGSRAAPSRCFDHGSIPYDLEKRKIILPTAQDKLLLGRIIADAYGGNRRPAHRPRDGYPRRQADADRSLRRKAKNYLECFKRGMLALSDYIKDTGRHRWRKKKPVYPRRFSRNPSGRGWWTSTSSRGRHGERRLRRRARRQLPTGEKNPSTCATPRSSGAKRCLSLLSVAFSQSALGSWVSPQATGSPSLPPAKRAMRRT